MQCKPQISVNMNPFNEVLVWGVIGPCTHQAFLQNALFECSWLCILRLGLCLQHLASWPYSYNPLKFEVRSSPSDYKDAPLLSSMIQAGPTACGQDLGSTKTCPSPINKTWMGISENREPKYSTLNSRILIIRSPKLRYPHFRKLPYWCCLCIYNATDR